MTQSKGRSILDQNDPEPAPNRGRAILDQNDPEPGTKTPKRNYALSEVSGAARRNIAKSSLQFAQDVVNAPGKAVKMVVETPAALANLAGGSYLNMLPASVRESILAADPRLKGATGTANAALQMYKDDYGGWENIKRTMAEKPVQFAADAASVLAIPGVGSTVGAGARAATNAATRAAAGTRVAAPLARTVNTVNRVVTAPGRAATAAGNIIRAGVDMMSPRDMMMLNALEGRGPQVLNALRNPRQIVPGSVPTAVQAVAPEEVATRFAAMGQAAAKRFPTQATEIKNAQNAARLAQIRQVGRTPADLQAAVAARDAAAARNYGASHGVMSTADDTLHDLLGRPSMDRVLARAAEISAERGRPFQIGVNAPARTTQSTVLGPDGRPVQINVPAQYARYSGENLHTVKQAFDDLAYDPAVKARFGIGATEIDAIRGTRNEFINWVESQNPAYRHARQTYAQQSGPIDRMRVGQYLEAKLQNPTLGEDTATLRADAFSNTLDNAINEALGNNNIRKATGQQRNLHIRDLLTPEEMAILESIQEDLARAKLAETQATAASQYGSALGSGASDAWGVRSINPSEFNVPVRLRNALARHLNPRIADEVGNAMLTPQGAAGLVENALARQARLDQISRRLQGGLRGATRYPALYQMLNQDPENQNALSK